MTKQRYFFLAAIVLLLLTACAGNQSNETTTSTAEPAVAVVEQPVESQLEPMGETSSEPAEESDSQPEQIDSPEEPSNGNNNDENLASARPAWQNLALTNVRTGETFTLADFEGKAVFVEPMATWCGNCRRQLGNVQSAQQQLPADDVVFVALSVETNIDDETLADYADGAGFDWLFAVATPDLLQELAGEFGRSIVNPPATPHFIIRPDGTSTELVTGIEEAGQIVSQIAAAQG